MERRKFLRGLVAGLPVAAGVAAGVAVKSKDYVHDASGVTLEALKKRVDELKTQFEETDAKNQKLIKVAIAIAALSLGLDVTAFL